MNHDFLFLHGSPFSGRSRFRRLGAYWLAVGVPAIAGCAPTSPATLPPEAAPDGKALYATYCASCHGAGGANDRSGANSAMRLTAANALPAADWNHLVQTGRGQMPGFANRLSLAECAALHDYIRRLTAPR